MLIPSIDLLGGRIVQLVQGQKLRLAFDDFEYWIERFSRFPLVQLIDLDAAMRQGDNSALVEQIAKRLPVQGWRRHPLHRSRAQQVLSAGAKRVIIGSAMFSDSGTVNTDFAAELADSVGADHIVAGIDTKNGRIAVKGWKAQVELTPDDAIPQLELTPPHSSIPMWMAKASCRGFRSKQPRACASLQGSSSSWPVAFAASRRSTRSMPWALTP